MKSIEIPSKMYSCNCEQCKSYKHLRKNRKMKRMVKRMINKRRRSSDGCGCLHYWS